MPKGNKYILLCGIVCLLFSCIKDVKIRIPKNTAKLVVNCLFNPDSSWKIFVGKSSSLSDTINVSLIKNAHVTLHDETGNNVNLVYLDSGYYVSTQKPKAGVKYTIKVSLSGYPSVEATDSIPASKLSIPLFQFDTIPTLITPANVFDNIKVNKLNLSMKNSRNKSYCQLQILAYNKNELYYYMITPKTLDTLSEMPFISKSTIEKLSLLKGYPIFSETEFRREVDEITGNSSTFYHIVKYAERVSKPKHLNNLFKLEGIYSQKPSFYNITGDYYSVFAEINQSLSENVLLYTSYDAFDPTTWWYDPINNGSKKDVEIWLDLKSLSASAYQYKTTYIKHQLNRENPFAQPVQVYSNIKGGYGIFAGYREERVKVY